MTIALKTTRSPDGRGCFVDGDHKGLREALFHDALAAHDLLAENERLRDALREIESEEFDWDFDVEENVEALQAIARDALNEGEAR
jgi:hypothetical protein